MNLYKFLEKPKIYNFIEKILSFGNKSENILLKEICFSPVCKNCNRFSRNLEVYNKIKMIKNFCHETK